MKTLLVILAILIIIGVVLPLIHLLVIGLVVAGAAIVVMAAWKVLFGGSRLASIGHDRGGPPALP